MSLLSPELFYVLAGSFLALVSARALLFSDARMQRAGAALQVHHEHGLRVSPRSIST